MRDEYTWDERSYDKVEANGLTWDQVQFVLYHSRPYIRSPMGAVLRVAAPDMAGRWLMVTLIEVKDDVYKVVTAHWLTPEEEAWAKKLLQGGM